MLFRSLLLLLLVVVVVSRAVPKISADTAPSSQLHVRMAQSSTLGSTVRRASVWYVCEAETGRQPVSLPALDGRDGRRASPSSLSSLSQRRRLLLLCFFFMLFDGRGGWRAPPPSLSSLSLWRRRLLLLWWRPLLLLYPLLQFFGDGRSETARRCCTLRTSVRRTCPPIAS